METSDAPRRGLIRRTGSWLGRRVARPMGWAEVRRGAIEIRDLSLAFRQLRRGPQVVLDAGRRIDLDATAAAIRERAAEAHAAGRLPMPEAKTLAACSAWDVRRLLEQRRQAAARGVWWNLAGVAGALLVCLWLGTRPGGVPWAAVPYALLWVLLMPFYLLRAFAAALTNWRLRTGRVGSVGEFFMTQDSWWPG